MPSYKIVTLSAIGRQLAARSRSVVAFRSPARAASGARRARRRNPWRGRKGDRPARQRRAHP